MSGADNAESGLWHGRFRWRLVFGMICFVAIYIVLAGKLVLATVIAPILPNPVVIAATRPDLADTIAPPDRAPILDRSGKILAVSLPSAALFADPKQIRHPRRDTSRILAILPFLNRRDLLIRLSNRHYGFVYLDRYLTSAQELAINRLGIPGIYFQRTWQRHYPNDDIAAHILGGVTPGQQGISGVERYFNKRLTRDPGRPLRLSVSVALENIVHKALAKAVSDYKAQGACSIVESMTGRVLAMVSLPDYNANDLHTVNPSLLFNRCVSGDYGPGSMMKVVTLAGAMQSGMMHYWDRFNTSHPLSLDGFVIRDYEPVTYWLAMPAILAYSSVIGTSRIATIMGPKLQRAWLRKLGFFKPPPIQLPGVQPPIWHPKADWRMLTTMTVSFGNGIAMAPMTLVNAEDAIVNGGILYRPTLLARRPGAPPRRGVRVMRRHVSVVMRNLMRDVVLSGTGIYARVHGYLVGGKTGTAQVVRPSGGYYNRLNDAGFIAIFPSNHPRYIVYAMVIHPKATKKMQHFCYGFTTGGYVAAPVVGSIIRQMGPLFGIPPLQGATLAAVSKRFRIPLKPPVPQGKTSLGPHDPFPPGTNRYAYILAHRTPPKLIDAAAVRQALRRIELAIPGQVIRRDRPRLITWDQAHQSVG
ncbi:peptidoglycan D,D-transpeptidase FtsI family protein [Acidiphilium sp.]|uniref:peptidoglycan D,D-transpeptidase FtsI family protein n=1 Tax=Acidiphilium sp. TaxID=527 RepID=UPI003D08EED3